jgi:hypothetical protein
MKMDRRHQAKPAPAAPGSGRFWKRLVLVAGAMCCLLATAFPALAAGLGTDSVTARPISSAGAVRSANFSGQTPSADTRRVADWVMSSGDNHGLPFMIVDKPNATTFLFTADGALLGVAPVLLGLGRGDDSPPGIGNVPLAAIPPADRITPAGRFEAAMGTNLEGQDILWIDYDAALSVHRASDPKRGLTARGRLARLASATVRDNRVSHGCVNVSAAFFEQVLRPAFAGSGIVYILPETRPIRDVFPLPA